MRLPGLGPKTARRIWKELGITTVRRAEGGRRGAAAARPRRDRRRHRGEDRRPRSRSRRRRRARAGRCSVRRCRSCARSSTSCASIPRRSRCRSPARHGGCARPSATSTSSRRRPTRRRSSITSARCRSSSTSPRRDRRRRRSSRTRATASTFASSRRRATGTCCSTSPAPRTTTSRFARTRSAAASPSPSTRSPRSRRGEEHHFAREEDVYRFLGYDWIPPELREDGGELAAARKGELPALVELSDLRGDLHTHTTWSDGKDPLEAMVDAAVKRGYAYYAICDHSQRLRGDLLQRQSEQIDALNDAREAAPDPEGDRGEHPARRHARRLRRGARDARLGGRVGALAVRPRPDRARLRRDGVARTSTASGTSRTGRSASARRRRSTSSASSRRRSRRGRSSRSTRSPTASTSPTSTRARRARRGSSS